MKTLKISFTALSLLLISVFSSPALNAQNPDKKANETPAKTIVIKNPGADDANAFFSNSQVYNFEIYKAGDVKSILAVIQKNQDIEACIANNPIGDFTPIQLSLKSTKNKAWFISLFKKAGLTTIRINQKAVMSVDKM